MSVPLNGLQDYARRMQANMNGNNTAVHPAIAKYNQSVQDTASQLPSAAAQAVNSPSVPPASISDINGDSPTSPLSSTNTNPNNPTSQNEMPNLPTTEQMAGAGNGGGMINGNSQSDAISNGSTGTTPVPTVDPTLLQDHTGEADPIADMGKLADAQQMNTIASMRQQQKDAASTANGSGTGILGGATSVNGFSNDQVANARTIIQAGIARGMSQSDIQIALMTALDESGLKNVNYGDRDSLGLFQQRTSQGWGNPQQIMDPNYAANKFFDALSGISGRNVMTPWGAAQAVQRSAYSDGSNYQKQYGAAQQLMSALYGNNGNTYQTVTPTGQKPNGSLTWINNNTNKYEDYDGYYGAQCVDLYAFYTTGFVGGNPYPVTTADQIWNHYDANAYAQVSRNSQTQMGDVAVFAKGGQTPGSHVAIILQDNGNGTLRTLSNNATSAGPNGNSTVVDIAKGSLIGYLRPRKLM